MPGGDHTDPFVSQEIWNELDHGGRVACLRLLGDREWVRDEVVRAQEIAEQEVDRRWLDLQRNLVPADLPLFYSERRSARAAAASHFWDDLGPREGRCAHGASEGGCRVRGCVHRWHPPPIPPDRYFKGALRTQILQRDNYTCQYCGKTVLDSLPYDHPDKANIDHVIHYPVGPTSLENGKTACTVCNAIKGADDSFPESIPLEDL